MAFNVVFYSFSKRDNSTKQPSSGGTTLSCEIKSQSSILNPFLMINTTITNPSNLNYAYIAEYGRYYWVTDWSWDRGFWYCNLSIDALATYKTQIGNASLYVLRADSASTASLIDGKYPMKNSVFVNSADVGANDFTDTTWGLNFRSGGCYILGVVGRGAKVSGTIYPPNAGGVTYYALTNTEMKNLIEVLFDGSLLASGDSISEEIQKEIFNPFQYIVSCQWIPTDLASSQYTTPAVIRFGYWFDDTVIGNYIPENLRNLYFNASITVPRHPQATRGTYLNGAPYTQLELTCFSFGNIPIDATPYAESPNMSLTIEMDVFTGTGFLNVKSPTGKLVHRQAGQIGVPVQLSQVTQNLINTGVSAVESAAGALIGNWVGAMHGIVSAIEGIFPQVRTSGEVGSSSAYNLIPTLTATFRYVADEDKTLLGRPVCQHLQISTLSGYILVEDGDIDIAATVGESSQIKSYLEGGFFYE